MQVNDLDSILMQLHDSFCAFQIFQIFMAFLCNNYLQMHAYDIKHKMISNLAPPPHLIHTVSVFVKCGEGPKERKIKLNEMMNGIYNDRVLEYLYGAWDEADAPPSESSSSAVVFRDGDLFPDSNGAM